MEQAKKQPGIAVVGVAALFPGSVDKEGFWRDILAGRDLVTEVPPSHWLIEDYYDPDPRARDKTYARRGAFLPEVDFDPVAWGVPPSIMSATDTTQVLALIVAQQVLQDACGAQWKDMPRDRVSVILGVTSGQELLGTMVSRLQRPVWVKALREMGLPESQVIEACDRIASEYPEWQESSFPGLLGNVVAGRIANRLDLGGTNCVTDAACASSFSALAMAVSELQLGHSDLVIAGGADTMNDIFMYMCFSKTPALSPTGDCRPFSEAADGTLLGEGIGMVALKRLADAERDGDRIYALVTGVGSSSDGRSRSVYAPVASGQSKALRRAYQQAGYGPDTVELLEAHGTGTRAGDAAEFEALRLVFDESGRKDRGWCALGSVKSQIGHTKAAAGAAGLFKAVMALHHKVLPPTIKVDRPDPKLAIADSAFYLNTRARPWPSDARHPRRASVSSFGFGGSNFHVALEEYDGVGRRPPRVPPVGGQVVLLGADSPPALAARCRALAAEAALPGMLAHLARTTQEAFDASSQARLAVFAESDQELAAKLARAAELVDGGHAMTAPGGIDFAVGPPDGEVAFLFPGQGSQYLHMGADVAMTFAPARMAWDRARALPLGTGARLDEVVFARPAYGDGEVDAQRARLTATQWAQPAIGACSLALLGVMDTLGLRPAAVAGHSFGEVTALCAAGVLSHDDLLRIASRRGELMAGAAHIPGAMTSVAAPAEELARRLADWNLDVVIANHNSPRQVVLSGAMGGIARAERLCAEAGFATTRLDVATAFHSPVVSAASAPLRSFLAQVDLTPPRLPVYGSASAAPYPSDVDSIREQLARQLGEPVRFVEQIEAMYAAGVRTFVEVGPGNALTSLVGHILKQRSHRAIALDRKGRPPLAALQQGLGALSVSGVTLSYGSLWADFAVPTDPRSMRRPGMVLKVGGSNHGKPYPPPGGAAALPKPNPEPAPQTAQPRAQTENELPSTAPRVPLSPAVADASVQLAWVQAFQESQRQTAEAHASFQRAMGEAHGAFLRSAEVSLTALTGLLGGSMTGDVGLTAVAGPAPGAAAHPALDRPARVHEQLLPPAPALPLPAPSAEEQPAPLARERAPERAAPAGTLSIDSLQRTIIEVVARCTGYPAEMLGLDMDIEADLGVDSIKRVEILSAMTEKVPGMAQVSGARVAALRTLREIVGVLGDALGIGDDGSRPDPNGGPRGTRRGGNGSGNGSGSASGGESPSNGEAAATTTAQATTVATARWGLRAVPRPAPGLGMTGLRAARRLVVTDDGAGIGTALVAILAAARLPATLVGQVPADADAVIFLGGLRAIVDVDGAIDVNREAFRAARAAAAQLSARGGAFVTVQDTGGDFGLRGSERAWLGGLCALARTASLEWPLAQVRALDVECAGRPASAIAEVIAHELLAGGPGAEIGLGADGTRVALEGRPAPLPALSAPDGALARGGLVVASGGARGVTAACLVALARTTGGRFLLLGRSEPRDEPAFCRGIEGDAALKRALLAEAAQRQEAPLPAEIGRRAAAIRAGREIRNTLREIRDAGGEARYAAVDVGDGPAVAAAVAITREQWGPVRGLVHGAGVLADKLIALKTDAQLDQVLRPKLAGLQSLLEATRADDLGFILLFSSVAARAGNRGQADYAMANEVLNKVAALEQRRRGSGCLVRALGWGPWDGGMVDAGLRAQFAARGVPLIPIAEGAQMFLRELASGSGDTEVVLGDAPDGSAPGRYADSPSLSCDILVDPATYPFVGDHRIKGTPVVPIALVLEWFARAARACRPDLTLVGCSGLEVLRGIRLAGFDGQRGKNDDKNDDKTDLLTLTARQLVRPVPGDGTVAIAVELLGASGARHYTATCEMSERRDPAPVVPRPTAAVSREPWTEPLYGRQALFHASSFQVIRDLHATIGPDGSRMGLAATMVGVRDKGWPGDWHLDPAMLDGGLQLALLWTRLRLGGPSLPTSVESLRVHAAGPAQGPVTAVLQGRECGRDRVSCDISFVTRDGALLADLRGVKTHLLSQHDDASAPIELAPQAGG